jgi:hypothetical protein
MKSESLYKLVPFFKPLESSEQDVLLMLLRIGGHIEALQGFKGNPEVGIRVNDAQLKLLHSAAQIILGLQGQICDFESGEEKDKKIADLEAELRKAHEIIAVLTDQKSLLLDQLEAK